MTDYTVLIVFDKMVLGRFVMARHRVRGWELPGGRVEGRETLSEAARREWTEETGLPLAWVEPVLLHHRRDGSRGHLFLGVTDASGAAEAPMDDKIEEVRFVERLVEVTPLAFPDDPYLEAAEAVLSRAAALGCRLPAGESASSFIARLSQHPEAHPKGHRVTTHPDARGPS